MQKREKIIVIMAVVVAIYGVIDFTLLSHKKKPATPAAAPASTSVVTTKDTPKGQVTAELPTNPPTPLGTLSSDRDHAVDRLAAALNDSWSGPIFTSTRPEFGGQEKLDKSRIAALSELRNKAKLLVYSGFLSMGSERIAIINGMDYQIGEEVGGLTVTKIDQDSVQVGGQDAVFDIPATTEQTPAAAAQKGPNPSHN